MYLNIVPLRTAQGELYLFADMDGTSRCAFAHATEKANRQATVQFLRKLAAVLPCKPHTMLTDNGARFTNGAPSWAFSTASPSPTAPGPTARSNAFTAPLKKPQSNATAATDTTHYAAASLPSSPPATSPAASNPSMA